jgi:hypothetical protein
VKLKKEKASTRLVKSRLTVELLCVKVSVIPIVVLLMNRMLAVLMYVQEHFDLFSAFRKSSTAQLEPTVMSSVPMRIPSI